MNNLLRKTMDIHVPKFSKAVVEGTVKEVFETLPSYLDKIIRSSIRSLNPVANLTYEGYSYVNPEEEFNTVYGPNKNNSPDFDLAHSDIYPIRFHFTYDGQPMQQTILLPYARSGNIFIVSGTKYVVVPVLTDTVITPQARQIFVRLLKGKLTFDCKDINFLYNGVTTNGLLIWSKIMKNTKKSGDLGKPVSSMSLYFLGKYGFYETVRRYISLEIKETLNRNIRSDDVIISDQDDVKLREKYNVYESTGIVPSDLKIKTDYKPHNIRIYIKKEIPQTSFIKHFVFGLLYALDILPEEAKEVYHLIITNNVQDEIFKWKMILGNIDYKGSYSPVKVSNDILEHFNNIEHYVDSIIQEQLKEIGLYVTNFFDLLYYIMKKFSDWTLSAKYYNSDIKNSYIDIKYYICHDIIIGFNKVILALNQRVNKVKGQKKVIRENEVAKIFSDEFKKKTIYSLVKSNKQNLNVIAADYPGCIKYPKATAQVELQARGDGVKKSVNSKMPESTRSISGSDLYFGSVLFLNKNTPSPRYRLNLFLKYNVHTGRIVIPPEMDKVITQVDSQLQGKSLDEINPDLIYEVDPDDIRIDE